MRAVITGATSMIGAALIEECLNSGTEILAVVRRNTSKISRIPQSELIRVEYADIDQFGQVCGDSKPYDVFYHLAWANTDKAHRDDPVLQEENIKATLEAVELANRLGCKKFIGAGSQAEYGIVDGVISPDTEPHPVISYGMAKLSAGMLSRRLCEMYGMTHIWGRIFSVYGRNDSEETMLNYAISQFIKGETAKFSAATQMWNYLHESDAGKMLFLLGKNNVRSGIYCIAGDGSRPLKEYIEIMKNAYGENAMCEFAEKDDTKRAVSLQPDISGLTESIGFRPQVTFQEGISDLIHYRKMKHQAIEN